MKTKKIETTKKTPVRTVEFTNLACALGALLEGDYKGISRRQFRLAVKEAIAYGDSAQLFAARTSRDHQPPDATMGDVVTIEITFGRKKGEMVTGRFVSWSEKNGRTKVLETTNGQKIRAGRFVSKER